MKHIIGNLFLSVILYAVFLRIGIAVARAKTISTNYIWYSAILMVSMGISFVNYIYQKPTQWYLPAIIIIIGILTLNIEGIYVTHKNVLMLIVIRTLSMLLCIHFLYKL